MTDTHSTKYMEKTKNTSVPLRASMRKFLTRAGPSKLVCVLHRIHTAVDWLYFSGKRNL